MQDFPLNLAEVQFAFTDEGKSVSLSDVLDLLAAGATAIHGEEGEGLADAATMKMAWALDMVPLDSLIRMFEEGIAQVDASDQADTADATCIRNIHEFLCSVRDGRQTASDPRWN